MKKYDNFFFHKFLNLIFFFYIYLPVGRRKKKRYCLLEYVYTENHGKVFQGRGTILHNFYVFLFCQGRKRQTLQIYENCDLRIFLSIYLFDKRFCAPTEPSLTYYSHLPSLTHNVIYWITVEWGLQGTENA